VTKKKLGLFKRLVIGGLVAGLVVSGTVNAYFWKTKQEEMRVIHVLDGDTFTLKRGVRVRLIGADAPAYDACLGQEATKKLEEFVLGKTVRLEGIKWDQWGRQMALVYADGVWVDEAMIKAGLAKAEYPDSKVNAGLRAAHNESSEKKVGIFGPECNQKYNAEEVNCQIKGNFDQTKWTKKYYLPECPHYNTVRVNLAAGDKFFCNEDEAQKAGFLLAEDCK